MFVISVPGNGFGQHDSERQVILRTFWANNEFSQIDQILPQTDKKNIMGPYSSGVDQ